MLKNYQKIHFQTIIVEYLAELDVMWTLIPIYLRLDSNFVFFFVTDKHSKHPEKKIKFINWFHVFLWFSKKKLTLITTWSTCCNRDLIFSTWVSKVLSCCINASWYVITWKNVNKMFCLLMRAGYKKIREIKLLLHINFTKMFKTYLEKMMRFLCNLVRNIYFHWV